MRDGHRLQGSGAPWAECGASMQALRQEVWQSTSPRCWAFLSIAVCPCRGQHLHGVGAQDLFVARVMVWMFSTWDVPFVSRSEQQGWTARISNSFELEGLKTQTGGQPTPWALDSPFRLTRWRTLASWGVQGPPRG